MAWRDTLDLQILGSVACEFENFGGQVFENGRQVDACFGADARLLSRKVSEMTLYATAGELRWRGHISASFFCAACEGTRGVLLGDDAYRAATHLKAGFGGVRLGSLDLRIAFPSCLASCLSCAPC
jgi:hypothetical protein